MNPRREIVAAIEAVEDPEVPVTLKDLGVLQSIDESDGLVQVRLLPTRLGCPGREAMVGRVREAVAGVDPGLRTEITWVSATWRPSMISPRGQAALSEFGYTLLASQQATACPYCHSTKVRAEGPFGGSLCKAPYTCIDCGSTFDALRSAVL
jgi:ring-1,2-phenylacetyl-CoA epoxidase subunit PaaD